MRLLPGSLFGRLVLLMTVGLVVAQLAGALLHFSERQRTVGRTVSYELAERIAAVYRLIDRESPERRAYLARQLSAPRQRLAIESAAPAGREPPYPLVDFRDNLRTLLGERVEIRMVEMPHPGYFGFDIYLRLASGEWLRLHGGAPERLFAWPWPLLVNLALMLAAVVVLVYFAARSTVRPLTELAAAARGLAGDLKRPPLPETGPSEVREAAQAFNAMQTTIRAGIEERERFLAAISHDLKTPLTRLRLRTEMLGDAALAGQFRSDIEDMQSLLDGALDYLQGKAVDEAIQPVDIVALAESLADDFAARGEVSLQAPESLRFPCRPRALKRALENLIDNALKYGGSASIEVRQTPEGLAIAIADRGPGLPEAELQKVFEPFYRVEGSRSRDTGGSGLGLAIVRQIVRSHGGEVALANGEKGGLLARVSLPARP